MSMTIRDTELPSPLPKALEMALRKKHYVVIETPPEPPNLLDGIPTLLEYVAAGNSAEDYNAYVEQLQERLAEQTDVDDIDDRTYPAMVVDGELSRLPED